jgi:lipid A ethanolaminephosphotransferase
MKLIRGRLRPMLTIETLVIAVVAWLAALLNGPWWSAALHGRSWANPETWLFVGCVYTALVAFHFVLLAPFANRWSVRLMLSLLVIASACTAYFIRSYAVIMDPAMMRNVLNTDFHEAGDLISASLLGFVLLSSVLPLALIWGVRLQRRPWPSAVVIRSASVIGALVIAVLIVLPVNRDLTSTMRNHRELRYLITPGNLIYGLAANSATDVRNARGPRALVAADARLVRVGAGDGRPRVFVLVVGETARADNFSLLGYPRPTTPELEKLDVTAFRNVSSCGTSTEVSVPCLFSPFGRANYDERRIKHSENLLHVLARAGYSVKWLDNQSGCKGVCEGPGIQVEKLGATDAPDLCRHGECYDGVLVRRLESELAATTRDTVLVLHMMGNHGPAYFRRYPAEFRKFFPDCASVELRDCTREEVVNAYDNAILYTDHVLAALIRALKVHADAIDGAMMYVSDHGESLGEHGLYLHGMPYAIAPRTQTHVPLISWISPEFSRAEQVDLRCLRNRSDDELSHDNVFHSVLGVLDVRTAAYLPAKDVFSRCRGDSRTILAREGPRSRT